MGKELDDLRTKLQRISTKNEKPKVTEEQLREAIPPTPDTSMNSMSFDTLSQAEKKLIAQKSTQILEKDKQRVRDYYKNVEEYNAQKKMEKALLNEKQSLQKLTAKIPPEVPDEMPYNEEDIEPEDASDYGDDGEDIEDGELEGSSTSDTVMLEQEMLDESLQQEQIEEQQRQRRSQLKADRLQLAQATDFETQRPVPMPARGLMHSSSKTMPQQQAQIRQQRPIKPEPTAQQTPSPEELELARVQQVLKEQERLQNVGAYRLEDIFIKHQINENLKELIRLLALQYAK